MERLYLRIGASCALVVLTALFGGCSREKAPGVYVADKKLTIEEMRPSDVIMRVNGKAITKRDYVLYQNSFAKVYRMSRGISFDAESVGVDDFVKSNEQRIPEILLKDELVRQAAAKEGVVATDDEVEAFAAPILDACKTRKLGLAGTAAKMGGAEAKYFVESIKAGLLGEKLVDRLIEKEYTEVSSEELTNQLAHVRRFNENADRMNALAREKLLKAKAEILAGGSFAEVAEKYSELRPEQGKEWQTVDIDELIGEGEAALKRWLLTANVGDISDPIDMDDGICIVGVVAKGEGELPQGVSGPAPLLYTLVRCTLYARQNMVELDEAESRKLLLDHKRQEWSKGLLKRLYDEAAIEFPNGSYLFKEEDTDAKENNE